MVEPRRAVESMVRYLTAHPEEIGRFVRSGLGLRLGVPLAAFRWILAEVTKDAGLEAQLEVDPPGLQFGATVDRMGTKMRITAALFVQDIDIDDRQIRIELRVEDLNIDILSHEKTQLSALIKSRALDLSRPGDLLAELPDIPPVVVMAKGNRFAIDLMRSDRFGEPRLREIVGLLSSLITVKEVRTEKSEHLDVSFRALPRGPRSAGRAMRDVVVEPGVSRARRLAGRLLRRTPARYLLGEGQPR
jgi:hypothetical protein